MLKKLLLLYSFFAASTAIGQFPLGGEFQVNSFTPGAQLVPSVGQQPAGDFVVVWTSYGSPGTDSSGYSIQGQRYASDGTSLGGQFQVNTYTTSNQTAPAVDMDADGNFVVVWMSYGAAGDNSVASIQAQRYASDGGLLGAQFQVNSYTTDSQRIPAVTINPENDFVVAWESGSSATDNDGSSIQGQRYASDGLPVGSEFQVNSYFTGDQLQPTIDASNNGFIVAWAGGIGGIETDIFSRRFATDGTPLGSDFQVNSYTTNLQTQASLAASPTGEFVTAWTSFEQDGDGFGVFGQRFDSSGSSVSAEFQINSFTTEDQQCAKITLGEPLGKDFQIAIVWKSDGPDDGDDNSGFGIRGRLFGSSGTASGNEFQVSTSITGDQRDPAVARSADGDFIVVWSSAVSSGPDLDESIQGQRFSTRIFSDGFESGDTSAWSNQVP